MDVGPAAASISGHSSPSPTTSSAHGIRSRTRRKASSSTSGAFFGMSLAANRITGMSDSIPNPARSSSRRGASSSARRRKYALSTQ